MRLRAVCLALMGLATVIIVSSCQDLNGPAPDPRLDEAYFRCRVQPILTKNCSMLACHGDGGRPFTIFARNRLRLADGELNAALSDAERDFNFRSAAAMVNADVPDESPLSRKPVATAAGGWFHGATRREAGFDVFDEENSEWTVLHDWTTGATDDPSCIEPGSDL